MSTIHFYLEPKIKPNKTTIDISDIRVQVDAGQKKWGKGIDLQSNKTTTKDINKFVKFKILEYEAYDFKDNKMWEVYKEDFQDFTVQIFKDCNQFNIQKL